MVESGRVDLGYSESNLDGFLTLNDDQTPVSVTLGYQAASYLGIEIAWADHGSFNGIGFNCPAPAVCVAGTVPAKGDLKSVSVFAVPQWHFNERISALAKLGISRWDLSSSLPAPKKDGTEFVYGASLRLRLTRSLEVQAGVEIAEDRDSALVGLRWSF